VRWAKEALLMSVNKEEGPEARERSRRQIAHLPPKSPASACAEAAKEEVDGLLLCERHALEAKLEGQIECWGEMLLHIELWSREGSRQNRTQIVELLDVERAKAKAAMERAYEDLDALRRSEAFGEEVASGGGGSFRRAPLLLLPPRDARPPSRGVRPVKEHCPDVGREDALGPTASRVDLLRPRQGRDHCGR